MFKRIQALRKEMGFTLVELLVTTTIIGVLAAVVTVGVSGASTTAQTKANIQLINGIQSGIDTFAAQNPLETVVPTSGTASADSTNYFGVSGAAGGVAVTTSDLVVDFTSSAGANAAFSSNFRLNNSASATFKCVISSATIPVTLKACRN